MSKKGINGPAGAGDRFYDRFRTGREVAHGIDVLHTGDALVFCDAGPSPVILFIGTAVQQGEVRLFADGRDEGVAGNEMVGSVQDLRHQAAAFGVGDILAVPENDPAFLHLDRCLEYTEADAVRLGLVDFQRIGRHVLESLAVIDPGFGAAADRGPAGIHGHIAAADDDDFLSKGELIRLLEVGKGLDGALLARNPEGRGFFRPGGEQDGVKAISELFQRQLFPDRNAGMENDPALMQEPLVGFHEGAVQAEGRDPIAEDAAQMVVGIVQMDLGPLPEEPDGCGDTGGPEPVSR